MILPGGADSSVLAHITTHCMGGVVKPWFAFLLSEKQKLFRDTGNVIPGPIVSAIKSKVLVKIPSAF